MYIKNIKIEGYKSFRKQTTINFKQGLNVLIGANNSGKSTVMNALRILLDRGSTKRLDIADFSRCESIKKYQKNPPQVTIQLTFKENENNSTPYSDELVTVSSWLTRIEHPFEAKLTYRFYLPEEELTAYQEAFNGYDDKDKFWKTLDRDFLKKYRYELLVGEPSHNNKVSYEDLDRFSYHFLDAIRDVERDMFRGNSSLLKEVIHFFLDYELKEAEEDNYEEVRKEVEEKRESFQRHAADVIKVFQERMKSGSQEIFKYASEMGAHKDKKEFIELDGALTETELYSALRLIIKNETGISLPLTHNGLGYNNLIYISLLLSKMQKDRDLSYLGSNASVFSVLAIEEPEAHLHPNMQYRFLKYLAKEQENKVNQIFITTHSPNITAAIDLDQIIVLQQQSNKDISIAYPGKVFDAKEDTVSKKYIQRFLDVTKADILFADKILFVEGITEQMVIPALLHGKEQDLEEQYISIINLGGRYFTHFLKLFNSDNENAINKKIAFITDRDPMREKKGEGENKPKKCASILLKKDEDNYTYEMISNPMYKSNQDLFKKDNDRIRGFIQDEKSATFEDALIYANPTCKELIVESMKNIEELENLMDKYDKNLLTIKNCLKGNSEFVNEVKSLIDELGNKVENADTLKRQIIAHRYLMSVSKGETAQEIVNVIMENDESIINIPEYIEEAIDWLLKY